MAHCVLGLCEKQGIAHLLHRASEARLVLVLVPAPAPDLILDLPVDAAGILTSFIVVCVFSTHIIMQHHVCWCIYPPPPPAKNLRPDLGLVLGPGLDLLRAGAVEAVRLVGMAVVVEGP